MAIQNINLSGNMQDMTYEEYMKLFDMPANQWTEHLINLANIVFVKTAKPVLECNAQEIQETIQAMQALMNANVVRSQKYHARLHDISENATETEREEIRKRDRQYKPKKDNNGNPTENYEYKRKISVSKEEKMKETLRGLGMSDEDINKFIIEKRK